MLIPYVAKSEGGTRSGLIADPPEVSLGQVTQVEEVPFCFTLHNRSNQDYTITDFLKPCSCTELNLPTFAKVPAGGSLLVQGKMDTRGKRGRSAMTLLASYCATGQEAAPNSPKMSLRLPLIAEVVPSIRANPEVVRIDDASWTNVTLERGTAQSFAIHEIEASDEFICHELVGSRLGERGDRFQLRLKMDRTKPGPELGADASASWIEFHTSESTEPTFRLPVAF